MIKNDLSSFIKSKEGEYWDNFREEMKANKL